MTFERYHTMTGSRGSLAEVWIDRDAKLVKKLYKPDGITIRNRPPLHTDLDQIRALYENELHWSKVLKSDLILEIYEHGELADGAGFYIMQEYVGPDLLHYFNSSDRLDNIVPDAAEQIVEMFEFFRDHSIYKLNNAMCNLTLADGRIKAFDFKYAIPRDPLKRHLEMHSIEQWIAKIDPRLPGMLADYV